MSCWWDTIMSHFVGTPLSIESQFELSWFLFVYQICWLTSMVNGWGHVGTASYLTKQFLVGFVALRPKSTAMVIAGRSVHLTTLFPGQAWTSGKPVIRAHTFACNWQQPFLNKSAEGRRMTVEIISWSISTKDRNRTRDPWLCYRLRYAARQKKKLFLGLPLCAIYLHFKWPFFSQ